MTKIVITSEAGVTKNFKNAVAHEVAAIQAEGFLPKGKEVLWLRDVLEYGEGMDISFYKKFTSEFWVLTTEVLGTGVAKAELFLRMNV